MALFYTGYRPILRGQSDSNWVNTYTNLVGTYSNWSLMSTKHALDGAPQANHVIGTGYSPHDVFMSRRFRGLDTKNAMDGSGAGPRVYYGVGRDVFGQSSTYDRDHPTAGHGGRYHPWEFKGLAGAKATPSGYGHVAFRDVAYAYWVNWFFHGLPADEILNNPGHAPRNIGAAGAPATFGRFDIYGFKGVTPSKTVNNPGQAATSGIYNNAYGDRDHLLGHNRVNEWYGVTAANALGTGSGRHHRGNH